ncbi:iron-containing alcohol dehydrogenase [Pseudoalteromonas mariniglutinosa]|uniref:iron-containing alcohol dehydrogenase n=1 Tax=Pseudoalteromonas mariniglutinosa TaxID=206042 RepID=UPI0038515BD5
MYYFFYRIYHFILKTLVSLIGIPDPILYQGKEGLETWLSTQKPNTKLLVVTDKTLAELAIPDVILEHMRSAQIQWYLYIDVAVNPTIENVENGVVCYQQQQCQGIVAIGGGSVMDCAKLIAARVTRPNKSLPQLKGLFKIIKSLPPVCAIPTTAGTGSETTVAAVVNDPQKKAKYAVTDFVLVPKSAILMAELTLSLPPTITATTGLDALTHAIEAYIGINGSTYSDEKALAAIKLIFSELPVVYTHTDNVAAREKMLLASFYAGQAFTRASVGYIHAIAHQLGANYGTAHGLANSVLLMPVLRFYGPAVYPKLAEIARYCHFSSANNSVTEDAMCFLNELDNLLVKLNIPSFLAEIKQQDIKTLAAAAIQEAHPGYPVPVFMDRAQCESILQKVSPTIHNEESFLSSSTLLMKN